MGRPRADKKKGKKVKRAAAISSKEKDAEQSTETPVPTTASTSSQSVATTDILNPSRDTVIEEENVEESGEKRMNESSVVEDDKAVEVVEKDVVEICERKGTCASLLYARAVRALRSIPEEAEFQNPMSTSDPLRIQIDACAAMIGRVYLVDEDAVIVTDEIKELVHAVSFTSDDVHELRHQFSLKNGIARAASGTQRVLPPLGKPRFLEDITGNIAYDVFAYEKRDIIVGKGVFIAAFALFSEDKPQTAIKIFDDLIQCLNEHNLQQHQRSRQSQQPQRQRGKGGSARSRKGGSNGGSNGEGNSVLCKCPNDIVVVARLLELRSQCRMAMGHAAEGHQALDEFKKARRDISTAIELNGTVEQRLVRALIVLPPGLEESGWKDRSVAELKEFIKETAYSLDQCPCFIEYIKLYGRATSDEDDAWAWPHVPTTEDSIVHWSVRAPPMVKRVTSLLLGRRPLRDDEIEKCGDSFTLKQMNAWSTCEKMHETRYNVFTALSVLFGTNPKSYTNGLHMYLMGQLEKQAMVFHQFFDNAFREIHDRNYASLKAAATGALFSKRLLIDSLTWEECVASWSHHCDEYPSCYTKEELQKSARQMYHKQRPCVVCQKPTQRACSHCHLMPICSDECLSRVWIAHVKSFNNQRASTGLSSQKLPSSTALPTQQ